MIIKVDKLKQIEHKMSSTVCLKLSTVCAFTGVLLESLKGFLLVLISWCLKWDILETEGVQCQTGIVFSITTVIQLRLLCWVQTFITLVRALLENRKNKWYHGILIAYSFPDNWWVYEQTPCVIFPPFMQSYSIYWS